MTIHYEKSLAGIVTLTADQPDSSVNIINGQFFAGLSAALDRIRDEGAVGVILASAKGAFIASEDIDRLYSSDDPAAYFVAAEHIKELFRRLETLGVPVVAALTGTALGGGLELALACHYRIALDDDRIFFGFPAVGLGGMPSAGGLVRTGRLIGLQPALEWLTQNRRYTPRQALEAGIVHELAPDPEDLMARARAWIKANPHAAAPWDQAAPYQIPGGGPDDPANAAFLAVAPAAIRQETRGNYPAPPAILAALAEGAQVNFATACRIESRYFAQLAAGQVSRNLVRAFRIQLNQIKRGLSRPAGIPPHPVTKVGVLGAGMMGHGIAHAAAKADLPVILVDADPEQAQAGKARIARLVEKQVQRKRISQAAAHDLLARVTPTADYGDLAGCDLIIEAVFENRAVKAAATQQAEAIMEPDGVFASNTSTLPITGLAAASARPANFIGLHFFSPVDKMKLVEIIVGEATSDATLARAFDFVLQIGKTPIVVNDSRGFYTSRVFGTWTNEGMALLGEGQSPAAIEMAGLQAGMPVGPLAVMDEVSLSLAAHVRDQAVADGQATAHPGHAVVDKMLALDRPGRGAGRGFYAYGGGEKRLWPGLAEYFPPASAQLPQQEMIDRLLFVQSLETVRCLDEGVLRSVADANLGSILGWGFAPFHGGTLQFINAYGLADFVARAQELAATYGDRFTPPPSLIERALNGEAFTD
ncbi:MAG: enoyl-CoA hydratase/isomerase family protein [Caldilineaceae bacterium]|nr:enoyl-CoA hydratase/isomerase family protein [Caldilineaceae bacterium]